MSDKIPDGEAVLVPPDKPKRHPLDQAQLEAEVEALDKEARKALKGPQPGVRGPVPDDDKERK